METKNMILHAMLEGEIVKLLVETGAENVLMSDGTTLAAYLAELVVSIGEKATSTDVTTEITEAVNVLRQEMLGDTPVDAYNTFTELAAYIAEHKDAADALTAAIADKADKATVDAIKATVEGLGALASKDKVSEADLDDALAQKLNTAAEDKPAVYVQASQPADMKNGDLWLQIL